MAKTTEEIKLEVENKLKAAQSNKEFKDIGRVQQTKKEKAAYRFITLNMLQELEQDEVMAYNMVKKENVWKEIDVTAEKANGVSSGAAFLKVKIREAVPTRPKDDKDKRASYVCFLEILQNDLSKCKTVTDIDFLSRIYQKLPFEEILKHFFVFIFKDLTAEQVINVVENHPFRFKYGLVEKIVTDVFSARFYNILIAPFNSDAAKDIWKEAKDKQAISKEEAEISISLMKDRRQNFIDKINLQIEKYVKATPKELVNIMNTEWKMPTFWKNIYKQDIDKFRDYGIKINNTKLEEGIKGFDEQEKKYQPREEDWNWFDKEEKKEDTVEVEGIGKMPKQPAINSKIPLTYIKRTGGYKIETNSPAEIISKFGFSAVNYGNYVNDVWSKEHTKHFLGAISDLGEMLNVDVKKVNQLGKLSIAFGAKGHGKAMATYYPQTKDINLTKSNGDGSIAHEWGHYFDNVLFEKDLKRATNQFCSQLPYMDRGLSEAFTELMNFIRKGNPEYTPTIPITFTAKKSDFKIQYYRTNDRGYRETATLEFKENIEETIAVLQWENKQYSLIQDDKSWNKAQIDAYGVILDHFGVDSYKVPMKLKTSYYYHTSYFFAFDYANFSFGTRTKYWVEDVELFARAFETVILKKLVDKNRASNYLVNGINLTEESREGFYKNPYPVNKELEFIESSIDWIVRRAKQLYELGDFVAPSNIKEDDYIEFKSGDTGKVENAMVVEESVDSISQSDIKSIKEFNLLSDIGVDLKQLKPNDISDSFFMGESLAKNGEKLKISGQEINLSYYGKNKIVRKITAIDQYGNKSIISFWIDNKDLVILHVEGGKKGAGYGTELIESLIRLAVDKKLDSVIANDVESLHSEIYWNKIGFSQDPNSRSNRILYIKNNYKHKSDDYKIELDVLGNNILTREEWNNLSKEEQNKLKGTINKSVTDMNGNAFSVDFNLAPIIQKLNDLGFSTGQSDSGTYSDHPNERYVGNDKNGKFKIGDIIKGGGNAYLSVWKPEATKIVEAGRKVNTQKQIDIYREAANKTGWIIEDTETFMQPSIRLSLPDTNDGTGRRAILEEASELTNKDYPNLRDKDFMKWLDIRNHVYEPTVVENHGGESILTDEQIIGKWNDLVNEMERLSLNENKSDSSNIYVGATYLEMNGKERLIFKIVGNDVYSVESDNYTLKNIDEIEYIEDLFSKQSEIKKMAKDRLDFYETGNLEKTLRRKEENNPESNQRNINRFLGSGNETKKITFIKDDKVESTVEVTETELKRENIERAIKGLSVLARDGNEDAAKAIKGLNIILRDLK